MIINLKRWQLGVAWYPKLADYRDMVVNHEVGHFLGNGHVVCPRKGAPAPVMARQTFGLEGCAQNPWPYPDGRTYVTGPARTQMIRPNVALGEKSGAEGNVCRCHRVVPDIPDGKV